jgi:hypothetical protein
MVASSATSPEYFKGHSLPTTRPSAPRVDNMISFLRTPSRCIAEVFLIFLSPGRNKQKKDGWILHLTIYDKQQNTDDDVKKEQENQNITAAAALLTGTLTYLLSTMQFLEDTITIDVFLIFLSSTPSPTIIG